MHFELKHGNQGLQPPDHLLGCCKLIQWFSMRRILAAILLTLLITAGASAQVVHATGKLLTQRWETTLDSGTRLTSPVVARPARGQVLFYIYSGASYTQALALCGDPKMAQPLAEALAKAGAGTPLSETSAEFTEEDGQAVVSLEQGGGHIGAAKATRAFNVPAYIEAIQGLGFKPIIVLRLPLYGTIDQSGFQTESSPLLATAFLTALSRFLP